jgi:tRNA pseudouridine38-40 synthase
MQRYFIQLAYNGTNYHGWQIQPNAFTVQEVLAKAISVLTRIETDVIGAGRTDTGVHASFFVAHFEMPEPIDHEFLCKKLGVFLPNDISIQAIFPVDREMHARFSALSRTYHYYISNRKEPFRKEFVAHCPYLLDSLAMNEAALLLFNYIDFTSFSKLHTDVKTNNCKIMKAEWREENGLMVFEIKADRFLRNMVRAIVGSLVDVGRGKSSAENFKAIIESKNRCQAGTSVSANGLFLTNIEYPGSVNLQFIRNNYSLF